MALILVETVILISVDSWRRGCDSSVLDVVAVILISVETGGVVAVILISVETWWRRGCDSHQC